MKESDNTLTSFDNDLTNIDGQDLEKNRVDKSRVEENRVEENSIGLASQDGGINDSNRDLIFETIASVC